jgi:hypothetical protein
MSNALAISIGLFVVGFFILDVTVLHLDVAVIAMRGLASLIDKMAFWRH